MKNFAVKTSEMIDALEFSWEYVLSVQRYRYLQLEWKKLPIQRKSGTWNFLERVRDTQKGDCCCSWELLILQLTSWVSSLWSWGRVCKGASSCHFESRNQAHISEDERRGVPGNVTLDNPLLFLTTLNTIYQETSLPRPSLRMGMLGGMQWRTSHL